MAEPCVQEGVPDDPTLLTRPLRLYQSQSRTSGMHCTTMVKDRSRLVAMEAVTYAGQNSIPSRVTEEAVTSRFPTAMGSLFLGSSVDGRPSRPSKRGHHMVFAARMLTIRPCMLGCLSLPVLQIQRGCTLTLSEWPKSYRRSPPHRRRSSEPHNKH